MELAIYEAFREAGIEEAKAKAIAANLNANFNTTVSKAIEQHYAVHSPQIAKKGDVETVRFEIEKLRLEIEKVRAEIEKSKTEIIRWMFGAIIAAAGIAMAIARLFFAAA